ncbi:MAG: efflux transporter periplasmic adaptor subunit [Flavobacterium sp.]|uniref:efflux RND transporter periplasmic adaptor subunit n=1 Tax=Flavobacterium sp. TaxID=239 RepID=UPI000C355A32|nr:efflux RND transporter periplasmic adaptor subunit [Flavobacterium sp.]MBF03407.1 efflux transporter periplasmic adaptor subunit [Flavobacterium sp.]|tara:strand:- start:3341 stop:4504 length:1164 start_codon:yes stop_codon:yes gene_type:complete
MKKIYITVIASLVLLSCGGDKKNSTEAVIEKGDLTQLRAKRGELITQSDALLAEIAKIDEAIGKLDENHKLALITTIAAKDTVFNHYLELQATVQTKQNIVLNAEYGGVLQQVYVKEGQKVSKGQTLAKIDDGGLGSQLAQMETQAALAKTTFERQQNLWNQKIGSEIQYLQAKTNYEAQVKAVSQMKAQIAKTVVRAPFSGTIDDIITEKGSVVGPGTPILRIVNLSDMYLEAEVPEKNIATVKKGTEVIVDFPILGETFNAKVTQASNYINPANRSFNIQIAVPSKNGQIKPNLTSKIQIKDYTNPKTIVVPISIISENAEGEQYLYVADNTTKDGQATAKKVIVKTGLTQGNYAEITEGIKNGDLVISEGARSVKDGQKVSIIK